VLQTMLKERLSRYSFLFVGYSANDSDISREIEWILKQVGPATKPRFLIATSIEAWRRQELSDQGVRVIVIRDYLQLPEILSEVAREATRIRLRRSPLPPAGLRPVAPILDDP